MLEIGISKRGDFMEFWKLMAQYILLELGWSLWSVVVAMTIVLRQWLWIKSYCNVVLFDVGEINSYSVNWN